MSMRIKTVFIFAQCCLLSACLSSKGFISTEAKYGSGVSLAKKHRVQPGDTLYAIAFRYGMSANELASANNISPPYTIFAGQTLHLKTPDDVDGLFSKKPTKNCRFQVLW